MADAFTPVNGIIRRVSAIDEVASGIIRKVPKIPVPVNGVIREGYMAFDPMIYSGSLSFDVGVGEGTSRPQNVKFSSIIPQGRIQEALDNGYTKIVMDLTAEYESLYGDNGKEIRWGPDDRDINYAYSFWSTTGYAGSWTSITDTPTISTNILQQMLNIGRTVDFSLYVNTYASARYIYFRGTISNVRFAK